MKTLMLKCVVFSRLIDGSIWTILRQSDVCLETDGDNRQFIRVSHVAKESREKKRTGDFRLVNGSDDGVVGGDAVSLMQTHNIVPLSGECCNVRF